MRSLTDNPGGVILDKAENILIWGATGQGRLMSAMILEQHQPEPSITVFDPLVETFEGPEEVCFVNDATRIAELIDAHSHFLVAIGGDNGHRRTSVSEKLLKSGLKSISVISQHSLVETTCIGIGAQIMPGAIVQKYCRLGNFCILNTGCTVDHDCILGNGVHIMGGASVAGEVDLGDFCSIGTNATVLPRVKIGKNAFVGAGAVVTRDVEPNSVVVGSPARILRMKQSANIF